LIEDINGRARDFAASESLNQIGLDHDRPARRIHKSGRRLHKRQLRCAHKAARTAAEHQVNTDKIRLLEQLVFRHEYGAGCRRTLGGEVLAPCDYGHAEGLADLRHRASDITEAEQSQRPATEIIANEALPPAGSQ
jgi:hypothetical protein